jgi:hypothetical protein
MSSLRCIGLLTVVLLSACDADKPPASPPKVAVQAPAAAAQGKPLPAPVIVPAQSAGVVASPVHELAPNVPVVPVVAASKPDKTQTQVSMKSQLAGKSSAAEQKASGGSGKSAKIKADTAQDANRAPVASKSKSAAQVVKDTRLPKAALDLSLPPDMVKQLTPPPNVITAAPQPKSPAAGPKPLLPKMFPDATSDPEFQLQGRLLSNEMQLQLRNESRKEVEGAALDFKFKQ